VTKVQQYHNQALSLALIKFIYTFENGSVIFKDNAANEEVELSI